MPEDIAQIMQMLQQNPDLAALPPQDATQGLPPLPLDPAADPMSGVGMGSAAPLSFPSTDPNALAQVVQDALMQLAEQDHQQLEMQQQQAALAAQPIIDQMMMQASAPQPPMGAPPAGDPMMAFGEAPGLPPLPAPPQDLGGMI